MLGFYGRLQDAISAFFHHPVMARLVHPVMIDWLNSIEGWYLTGGWYLNKG
jgi:hypothetical protein